MYHEIWILYNWQKSINTSLSGFETRFFVMSFCELGQHPENKFLFPIPWTHLIFERPFIENFKEFIHGWGKYFYHLDICYVMKVFIKFFIKWPFLQYYPLRTKFEMNTEYFKKRVKSENRLNCLQSWQK